MLVYIYSKTAAHHRQWCKAFAEGLKSHNVRHKLTYSTSYMSPEDANLHVFWSMKHNKIINYCYEYRIPFVCLERGYIDREKFTSVNLNGLNGRSMLNVSDFVNDNSRALAHGWKLKQRKKEGNIVYVMGQMPSDAALGGINIYDWAYHKLMFYKEAGAKVMFKPHPLDAYYNSISTFNGFKIFKGTIDEALEDAALVHTYSSNSAVDAWMQGVPALADSELSMIYNWQTKTGHCSNIEQFINTVSFRQYSEDEFKSGLVWEIVRKCIQN